MSSDEKQGRPDLDLDFTFHSSDQMKRVDVSKKGFFEERLKGADEKFKADVGKTRKDLLESNRKGKVLAVQKSAAREEKDVKAEQKIDRQIAQNKLMVASKTQELQRAYYFGRKGQSQDAVNKYSKSGRGRADIVTDKIVGEETTARNKKKSRQLEDHAKLAAKTGKKPIMYAPNMRKSGVTHAMRKGMDVAGTQLEYHQKVRKMYRVIRDDPEKIKAARERNNAKKNQLHAQKGRAEIRQFFAEHRVERAKAKEARKAGDLKPMQDANKKLADFRNKKRVEIAERNLKSIEQRAAQRREFSQDRKEKMAAFKQQKAQAELKGDRSKVREVRQQAKPVVQELRAQSSKHAVQAQKDKNSKVQHEKRLTELKGQGQKKDQQQKQTQTSQYKSQVKNGSIRTQFTAAQSKDGVGKMHRSETSGMVKDNSIQKINGYGRARFGRIFDRAYNAAIRRGTSPLNAKEAAQDRVSHVMGRVELMQEKAQMKKSGVTKEKPIKAYFEKDAQFRSQRVKDLQAQASREGRAYKGPPQRPSDLRQLETKIHAREYTYRAKLEGNSKKDGWSASEHKSKSNTLEGSLTKMRNRDLGSYFSMNYTSAKTYGYNSANFSPSKGTGNQSQNHNQAQTQKHSGRSMHH